MFDKKLESLNVRHKINYGFNFVIKLMVATGILSIMALSWVFKDVKKNIGASGSLSSTTAVFIIGIILIIAFVVFAIYFSKDAWYKDRSVYHRTFDRNRKGY